jgi:hypothetical protein
VAYVGEHYPHALPRVRQVRIGDAHGDAPEPQSAAANAATAPPPA